MSQNTKRIEWPGNLEVIMKSTHPTTLNMHTSDLLSALHHNVCIVTKSDIVDAHSK